jgi:hypothetical protein
MMTAYPVAGKKKSFDICLAFVRGCGGQIGTKLRDGPAFFYGVDESNVDIWRAVRADGRDWYYCDNSYFDDSRQDTFRVTKNRLQHSGFGRTTGKRFDALDVAIKPWRTAGEHIVVCPQSTPFMRNVIGYSGDWLEHTLAALKNSTQRPIRVRGWSADKGKLAATLQQDLAGAHALVTWSSAAAITAVLSGVPVVTMGQCAAERMAGSLTALEALPMLDRVEWAGVLADNEWSLDEMRDGTAWRALNGA